MPAAPRAASVWRPERQLPQRLPRLAGLVHSTDFRRLLATKALARSEHFAVHHDIGAASTPESADITAREMNLSTGPAPEGTEAVDKSIGWRLGVVLPKRHARRAVTRNLLRRQMRAAMLRHQPGLPRGDWLIRLQRGFETSRFPSAASEALRLASRAELDTLLQRAARR